MRILKRTIFYVGIVFIGISLSALSGEIFLRIIYKPPYKYIRCEGNTSIDPDYGVFNRPNYNCYYKYDAILSKLPNAKENIFTNSFGMRDFEISNENINGDYRIMFLGDSYVAAWSVLRSETLARQYEDIYEKDSYMNERKVVAINAGYSGFCTYQEAEWFKKVGYKLNPDYLFLVFTHNDVTGYKGNLKRKITNGFVVPKGREEINKIAGIWVVKPFNADEFFTMNTYMYQFYKFWVKPFLGMVKQEEKVQLGTKILWSYQDEPRYEPILKDVEKDIVRIRQLQEAKGKGFAIILLPAESEVRDDEVDGLFFKNIREIGNRNAIPIIDTLPALRKARQEGIKVFGNVYDGDLHTSAQGISIVAQLSHAFLKRQHTK